MESIGKIKRSLKAISAMQLALILLGLLIIAYGIFETVRVRQLEKRLAKVEIERTRLLVQQHNLKELYLLSLRAQSLAAKSGHRSAGMDELRFREVLKVLEIETGTTMSSDSSLNTTRNTPRLVRNK